MLCVWFSIKLISDFSNAVHSRVLLLFFPSACFLVLGLCFMFYVEGSSHSFKNLFNCRVADPHHFNQIRIQLFTSMPIGIQLFILMQIRIRILLLIKVMGVSRSSGAPFGASRPPWWASKALHGSVFEPQRLLNFVRIQLEADPNPDPQLPKLMRIPDPQPWAGFFKQSIRG
jgi:hypothetical protein